MVQAYEMKEYTEIEILNPVEDIDSIMTTKGQVTFRFDNDTFKRFAGGRPISRIDKNTIKFSTQGYYEGIPLSALKAGINLELFEDWKKENWIANGRIRKRYFEKSCREDWQIKTEINLSNCKLLEVEIQLSNEEKRWLEFGHTPLAMEDKWFSFTEDNIIRFFRSWTGTEVFQAEIKEIENDRWVIKEVRAMKNLKSLLFSNKSLFKDLVKSQISRVKHAIIEQ